MKCVELGIYLAKTGKEHKAATKEQEYAKRFKKRILIVDEEPDVTIAFEKGFSVTLHNFSCKSSNFQ